MADDITKNTIRTIRRNSSDSEPLIYTDLNVRLDVVDTNDINIANAKAVLQAVSRLLMTQEGEIPYYRNYGLNLKRYIQRPLTQATANEIYDYVRKKIETYEQRVTVIGAQTDADFMGGYIYMTFTLQVNSTGEINQTDTLGVKVLV